MNEIQATGTLGFKKGSVGPLSLGLNSMYDTVFGVDATQKTQSVGTTPEAIDLGDITTPGWIIIQNNDLQHDCIVLDSVSGNAFMRIKPGFVGGPVYLECPAPAVQGDGATIPIEYLVVSR